MPPSPSGVAPTTSPYRPLLVGATILGLLASAQHFAQMQLTATDPSWRTVRHALSREMPWWYLWVVASPLTVWASNRVPLRKGKLLIAIPFHLGFAAVLVMAHSAAVLAMHRLLGYPTGSDPFWPTYLSAVPFRLTTGILGYGMMFGCVLAVDYYGRYREREVAAALLGTQLAEARLQALRMQLNPHFLFNAMNTIAMLVRRQENGAAVKMVAGLSELLRSVLEEAPPQEVPLRREIAFIERYLELERTRFPDRLRHEIKAAPETLDCLVPNLILQPLVENAVKHGIAARPEGGTVWVTAEIMEGELRLTVADDGPGIREVSPSIVTPASGIPVSGGGIGLANTESRLEQLYGDRGRIELESHADGFTARVVLPARARTGAPEVAA
jgi:hypothetical protein